MKFYFETERLILREVLESDTQAMFKLDSDPIVHKYLGKNPIKTTNQANANINFIRAQYKQHGIGRLATIEKSSGLFMGWSGIKLNIGKKESLNNRTNFYDIGYRLIPRFWGQGYATESSIKMLDYGFNKMKIDTIFGAADVQNTGSNKVLQKIGLNFIEEFIFKQEKINWYELNKKDYEKKMS